MNVERCGLILGQDVKLMTNEEIFAAYVDQIIGHAKSDNRELVANLLREWGEKERRAGQKYLAALIAHEISFYL
jgi:hypothetical protein